MIDLAHVHPMIVHFPIVLFTALLLLDVFILAGGGNLTGRETLPRVALATLLLGMLAAALAAVFGDMALDIAVDKGFSEDAIEGHEEMAMLTLYVFGAALALRLLLYWRKIDLAGARGLAVALIGLVGVGFMAVTAYRGGELVYHLGVNVAAIQP